MTLHASDAAELAEHLELLTGRLSHDPASLAASPEQFAGHPAYGTRQLREDLNHSTFLLGGGDGSSSPLTGRSRPAGPAPGRD